MKKFIHLGLFLMFIALLCWHLTLTVTLNNIMYGPQKHSPKLLLVQNLVEKSSRRPNVPGQVKTDHEIGESPAAPRQEESPPVEKISGDAELLVCQGQTDQIQHQLKNKLVLPQYVIDQVKTLVFFIGHAHSGHSIVGSLMDAHPHMVISHEVNLVTKLSEGAIAPNKTEIFNAIWSNTVQTLIKGVRTRNTKGYNLTVDSPCEGRYADNIDVIGDKQGGETVSLIRNNPTRWLAALTILKSLNVTLKVILVLRNPYDVIASSLFLDRHIHKKSYSERTILSAKKEYNLDIIEIHNKDLILDPRGTLLKLCGSLGVTCSDNYLDICSNKIYKTESRTRHLITWTNEGLQMVHQNIEKYNLLKNYTFDSL